jgi:hypothetical protein
MPERLREPSRAGPSTRTKRTLALVGLVVTSLLAVPAGVGASNHDAVLVVQPSVEPTQPTTDENFTVNAQVTNRPGTGNGPFYVEDVAVRNGSAASSELYGREESRLVVGAGETRTQDVEVDLDRSGTRTLYLHVTMGNPGGDDFEVVRPVEVVVRDGHPTLSLSGGTVRPDGEADLTLTVANGLDSEIRGLTVELAERGFSLADDRRVTGSLAPGEERRYTLEAGDLSPGTLETTAAVSYATADSDGRYVERELEATVSRPGGPDPTLSATAGPVGVDGTTTVEVTAVNARDTAIRAATLELASEDVALGESRQVRPTIETGGETTFSFDTREVTPGRKSLAATLTYTTANGSERRVVENLSVDVDRVTNPGNVSLTGLRVSPDAGGLSIRGSASNVGSTNASGVVVSVGESVTAAPAQAQSTFFAGNIPGGEFTSFDVTARPLTNGTVTVPVEVSYVVDGVRTERTVEVRYTAPETPDRSRGGGGGGLPLVLLGVGALVVVGGVLLWRRR